MLYVRVVSRETSLKTLVLQVFLAETANSSACLPGKMSKASLLIFPVG